MFISGIIVGVIGFLIFLISFGNLKPDDKAGLKWFSLFIEFFALSLCVFSGITTVSAGSVGIVSLFGSVSDEVLTPGIHLVNPLSKVKEMSTRTENYWMSHQEHEGNVSRDDSVSVRSSDGLQMPVDVSVPYRLTPEAATWVYKNLGEEYVEKLMRPALSTAARRAGSRYTAEELYSTKRDAFADETQKLLEEELTRTLQTSYKGKSPPENVVIVSQVLIGHVGIPEMVKTAIENKLKADQEAQAMEFTILKATKEAERKKIEAGGIQAFQEIVSKGIDDRLLRWKAIDATLQLAESHNAKVVIIGGGKDGLPVLLSNALDAATSK